MRAGVARWGWHPLGAPAWTGSRRRWGRSGGAEAQLGPAYPGDHRRGGALHHPGRLHVGEAVEQLVEHDPPLEAGQRRPQAEVVPLAEGEVGVGVAPHVELVRSPGLSIVLFRRPGWRKPDYEAWSNRLLHEQLGFVTPTSWEGETVARFAFLHPDATVEMVDEILDSLR